MRAIFDDGKTAKMDETETWDLFLRVVVWVVVEKKVY